MASHGTKVEETAYRLWELAGKPEGRDLEFWSMAEHRIGHETTNSSRATITLGLGVPRDTPDLL